MINIGSTISEKEVKTERPDITPDKTIKIAFLRSVPYIKRARALTNKRG
jgi:hypothetical protein